MWLCCGVSVNYHSLADFRVGNQEFLDQLLIQSIAALLKEGLVSMQRMAQDGKEIRASAECGSFHREESLTKHLEQARQQVETLRKQLEAMEIRAQQTGRAKRDQKAGKERRASETDPQARVMKMANGASIGL
jgi:hypothetical protein